MFRVFRALTAASVTFFTGRYSTSEIETWGVVYDKIMRLVPTHACHEYQYILPVMREKCAFSRDSIPQMSVISDFLKVRCAFSSCCFPTITASSGLYWLYSSSGQRFADVARFSQRSSLSRVLLHAVHPASQQTSLYSGA